MANVSYNVVLSLQYMKTYIFFLQVATEGQYGIGLGIKREVFFLNLEDGYFGCQVNESTQILQLYELSKLCDGVPDCYKASDELRSDLKCTGERFYFLQICNYL